MKIRNAFIIGLDSWYIGYNSENELKVSPYSESIILDHFNFQSFELGPESFSMAYSQVATGEKEPNATIFPVRPDNIPSGFHAWWINKRSVPDYWKDKIHSTYLRARIRDEYLTWQAIAILQPDRIPAMLKDIESYEMNQIDALFQAILPKCSGEHVDIAYRPKMRTSTVLYLEPDAPLVSGLENPEKKDLNDVAKSMAVFLGQDKKCVQPNVLFDLITFHSIESNQPPIGLTAVRLFPTEEEKRDGVIVMPSTVMDIANYFGLAYLVEHLQKRLKRQPFIMMSPIQYVKNIKNKNNKSDLNTYEKLYLYDREIALNERLRVNYILDAFLEEVKQNFVNFALVDRNSTHLEIKISDPFLLAYKYHVLDKAMDYHNKARISVQKLLEQLKEHEDTISDYFRDSINIEVSQSSFKLQSIMKWISIIALFIAFVAMFTGIFSILPDEIKTILFKKYLE